jgi:hypothetical protein
LTDVTFTKEFYLGTPPSLNLATTDDFAGCALFFEGIARSLPLNGVTEYGSVTCSQTLQDACVNDLLAQAKKQVQTLRTSASGGTGAVCSALQSTLEANPPQSCLSIATVTWGSVVAKGKLLYMLCETSPALHLLNLRSSNHRPPICICKPYLPNDMPSCFYRPRRVQLQHCARGDSNPHV